MGHDSETNKECVEVRADESFGEDEWRELMEMDFGPSRAMWGTFAPLVLILGAAILAVACLVAK